jgi:hypothetical protein
MNSIGVDFKLKNIELDSKKIKLQIVSLKLTQSGTQPVRKDSEQLPPVTTRVLKQLLLFTMSRTKNPSIMLKTGC